MSMNQRISLTSPLGDELFATRVVVQEELGRLFEIHLDLLSPKPDTSFEALLGQTLTVTIDTSGGESRSWNGYTTGFSQGLAVGEFASFRAVVRPWLWFLTRRSDCRIFQEKTVPDIVKEVFREAGFSDFEDKLTGSYAPREYCVQYRETDFSFASRLMEEEGFYYFFEHQDGKHTMVLADSYSSHSTAPGYATVPFFPPGGGDAKERDHINAWNLSKSVQPGTTALNDYDFERPKADLNTKSAVPRDHAQSQFEMYDFPGRYTKTADGNRLAQVRIEEFAAQHERAEVAGTVRGLGAGHLFSLEEFPREDQNREYLVVSTHIFFESDEHQVESQSAEPLSCDMEIIDAQQQFRPARTTPTPRVDGPQTALVVGKKGEEIWTDKHGRIKVQFPWDRHGKSDETSSCWIRVASPWGGKKFGGVQIPRIGEEVVVSFLEGDPDRPIVTGRVFNGDNMPPYDLPKNQTQSGLKSHSSKDGTPENFNELRFEDAKGEEELYIQAEKDLNCVVKNDESHKVGFETKDKGNQIVEIFNNQDLKIGDAQASDGSQTVQIWKDRTTSLKTGDDSLELTAGNQTTKLTAGNQTTKLMAGKATTDAMQSIELKVGANSIKIDQTGVTIKGIMIKVEGNAMVDVKGAMTTVQGQGMLTLKGGMLMLN